MPIRKSTLLQGGPKRPTAPAPHSGMVHSSVVQDQRINVRGMSRTAVGHVTGRVFAGALDDSTMVHEPTRAKNLAPVEINPGTRSRRNDSAAGTAAPAPIVDRAAPGAVKSRRA